MRSKCQPQDQSLQWFFVCVLGKCYGALFQGVDPGEEDDDDEDDDNYLMWTFIFI